MKLALHRQWLILPALLLLICGLPIRSLALAFIKDVSKEHARDFGITEDM